MSLPTNNKQKGNKENKGNKNPKGSNPGSKFILKPGKSASFSQKPHKAGGTRGS